MNNDITLAEQMSVIQIRSQVSNPNIVYPRSNTISRLTEHTSSNRNMAPTDSIKSKPTLPVVKEEDRMMLTDDQKSPIYLRLEAMIDTLAKVRAEMKGSRVPAYE